MPVPFIGHSPRVQSASYIIRSLFIIPKSCYNLFYMLDPFLKPSLNKRLVMMMLLLSMGLISVLLFLYYYTEKALYNEFERQVSDLTKAIQIAFSETTSSSMSDPKRLEDYLKGHNVKGLKEISIISNSDRIIASTNPENVGKWITKSKKELIFKAELGYPVTGEGQVYNVIIPVVSGNTTVGYIHFTLNTEAFSVFLQTSAMRRIVAALIIFGIGIVFTIVLARRYTKPIEMVVMAAKEVASGNLEQEIKTNRRDEIGELARSFNYMVEKLREERELKERLRDAEHLAGIGQIAQSIAHEIKNPLNFISLSIDHMLEHYRPSNKEDRERFESLITNIKNEIQRLSRFAGSFLDYGKAIELNLQKVKIIQIIEEVLSLTVSKAGQNNVLIRKEYKASPELVVDPDFIKTCIYNIIINAFEAMPNGGTITIKTDAVDSRFLLMIGDTGVGIPEDRLSRIFEPFFSTKARGLGIGLSLTKRIIEEHGGKITFESREGVGSTVTVNLPIGRSS
ncbi:MAG: HAMP domain-containing sensor histidine kinase [Thermodesulfovibrionia bacterium]